MAAVRSEGGDGDGRRRTRNKKVEPRLSRRASGSSIAGSGSGGGAVSSASGRAAGGRRRSFGSDIDVMFSHLSTRLAAHESSGPESDPDRKRTTETLTPPSNKNLPPKSAEVEEAKDEVQEEETIDSASQSFSIAVRECQNRRVRSVATSSPVKKLTRRRPASLDLNGPLGVDAVVQSPRFLMGGPRGTQKTSASATSSRSRSGVFPSPVTPGYRNGGSMAYQKGWSSERVPLPANSSRRYMGGGGSALLPFNNGRTLPSKWDDAEKWICSPVSGDGSRRPSVPPPQHRRPKSKSGPLGPPGGPYSAASPLIPCFDNGRIGNFAAESPFMAGVLVPDRGCLGSYSSAGSEVGGGGSIGSIAEGGRRSYSANAEPYIARSASVHGWCELIESSSMPSSQGTIQDDKLESCREAAIRISPVVLRKDVATQMSPERSIQSSPKESPSPSAQPIQELESHFSKPEVRDVQVDDQGTVTRWSKKLVIRGPDKRSIKIIECRKKTDEAKDSAWGVAEPAKIVSMCKREEAKITAWENLQKAKAEAEIQKLEMKLEKKRSSSMDKILNKLRYAQRKAQEMRSAASTSEVPVVSPSQAHEVARTTKKLSYFRRTAQMSSFSGCFTCPAF